jgi:tetratricopeptide (TPR) repeat protein
MLNRLQLSILISAIIGGLWLSPTTAAAQRRRSAVPLQTPNPAATNALDTLGLYQPESIRSILLLYLARNLPKAKVAQLEGDVRTHPDNIDDRLSLIGYYSWNGKTAVDRLRLRSQVLWMLENHPEHAATAEPALRDLPDDPEGNIEILKLWRKNLEARGDNFNVLKNAEKFFFSKDPAEAERILHLLYEKEPLNREWATELCRLYTMFGIPGEENADAGKTAAEAYHRVLEVTRDPRSQIALAGDMADADFRAGNLQGAAALAKIYLDSSDRPAIQRANTLLGRVALRTGDTAGAKQYLLDSAKPAAGLYVAVSGPMLILAKELLEKGQRDIVLQYLQTCLTLWPRGEEVLHIWIDDLHNGRTPDFGNLGN